MVYRRRRYRRRGFRKRRRIPKTNYHWMNFTIRHSRKGFEYTPGATVDTYFTEGARRCEGLPGEVLNYSRPFHNGHDWIVSDTNPGSLLLYVNNSSYQKWISQKFNANPCADIGDSQGMLWKLNVHRTTTTFRISNMCNGNLKFTVYFCRANRDIQDPTDFGNYPHLLFERAAAAASETSAGLAWDVSPALTPFNTPGFGMFWKIASTRHIDLNPGQEFGIGVRCYENWTVSGQKLGALLSKNVIPDPVEGCESGYCPIYTTVAGRTWAIFIRCIGQPAVGIANAINYTSCGFTVFWQQRIKVSEPSGSKSVLRNLVGGSDLDPRSGSANVFVNDDSGRTVAFNRAPDIECVPTVDCVSKVGEKRKKVLDAKPPLPTAREPFHRVFTDSDDDDDGETLGSEDSETDVEFIDPPNQPQ